MLQERNPKPKEEEEKEKEKMFYQDGRVLVSSARLVIDDKTFVLPAIGSISLAEVPKNRNRNIVIVIAGIGLMLFGLNDQNQKLDSWLAFLVCGLFLVGSGIYYLWKDKNQFFLKLSTNGALLDVFLTDSADYANLVLSEINKALVFK